MAYNPYSLGGKTILVTGASGGIGRATAIECSRLGAKVVLTARNEKNLQKVLSELDGSGHELIPADLLIESDIERIVNTIPILDGLVNNAGINMYVPIPYVSEQKLLNVLNVNSVSPILLFSKMLKNKKIKNNSSIVFTSSLGGNYTAVYGGAMYSASKGAVSGFVRTAAVELAPKNIRVNAVCPGMTDTAMTHDDSITEEQYAADRKRYPLKRYAKPEEIAWAIIYLLSDASGFTTGTNLIVDGGFSVNWE